MSEMGDGRTGSTWLRIEPEFICGYRGAPGSVVCGEEIGGFGFGLMDGISKRQRHRLGQR